MGEHMHPKRSGKYEWQTQKVYERLIDILRNATSTIDLGGQKHEVTMIAPWVAERLADELIKHGVTIPTFKVGDIVWVYDFMWGIIPCTVDRPYHCHAGREGSCTYENSFTELDIGEYVFATKEEAEAMWPSTDNIMRGKV